MVECIFGSVIGTLIGLLGAIYIAEWQINKDIKKIKKLIEDANTFKITLKNEIFRKG